MMARWKNKPVNPILKASRLSLLHALAPGVVCLAQLLQHLEVFLPDDRDIIMSHGGDFSVHERFVESLRRRRAGCWF